MAFDGDDNEQVRTWEDLYDCLREILLKFGSEDGERTADCWIDEDNWGYRQHKIYVRNLKMLQPHVVKAIQRLLPLFIRLTPQGRNVGRAASDLNLTKLARPREVSKEHSVVEIVNSYRYIL
jgi:hypothetical protein